MNFQHRLAQLRQQYHAAKFQFVNVELELAITYCLIALVTVDRARSCRNVGNAERAYSAAAYFLDGHLSAAQILEVKEKLVRFRSLRASCDTAEGEDDFGEAGSNSLLSRHHGGASAFSPSD